MNSLRPFLGGKCKFPEFRQLKFFYRWHDWNIGCDVILSERARHLTSLPHLPPLPPVSPVPFSNTDLDCRLAQQWLVDKAGSCPFRTPAFFVFWED